MNSWFKLSLLVGVLSCFTQVTHAQFIDEDLLPYLQFMSYMSSMTQDVSSMAFTVPRIARTIDPSLVASIVRNVLSSIPFLLTSSSPSNSPVVVSSPPEGIPAPAQEIPNVITTKSRSDAGPNFFPSSFDIFDGTIML